MRCTDKKGKWSDLRWENKEINRETETGPGGKLEKRGVQNINVMERP